MDSSTLKKYQSQLSKAKEGITFLKLTQRQTSQEIETKSKQIKELERKINNLKQKEVVVSEHAILRYCERVLNIDMDDIRKTILNDTLLKQVEVLGANGTYPVENICKAVLKDGVVVTITEQ